MLTSLRSLVGKSLVSINQFKTTEQTEAFIRLAHHFKAEAEHRKPVRLLEGVRVMNMFCEASTRTLLSFDAAARQLGADTISIHEMKTMSSFAKGESIADTFETIFRINRYSQFGAIAFRHPADDAALQADMVARQWNVRILNAGSGSAEHPSQALLDLVTIHFHRPEGIEGLSIVFAGDPLYGRTIRSLGQLLSLYSRVTITFVCPEQLDPPPEFVTQLRDRGAGVQILRSLDTAIPYCDVLYMTRIQRERFPDGNDGDKLYQVVRGKVLLTHGLATKMSPRSIILHPLPRVDEIAYEVDTLPNARYFDQVENGVYTRKALLALAVPQAAERLAHELDQRLITH